MKTKNVIGKLFAAAFLSFPLWIMAEAKPENESAGNAQKEPLEKFDKDGDGVMNEAEREAARQALRKGMQVTNWPETRRLEPLENGKKPGVEKPKAELPKAELPKVEVPKVEAPEVELPKVEVPKTEVPAEKSPRTTEKPGDKKPAIRINRVNIQVTNWPEERRLPAAAVPAEEKPKGIELRPDGMNPAPQRRTPVTDF